MAMNHSSAPQRNRGLIKLKMWNVLVTVLKWPYWWICLIGKLEGDCRKLWWHEPAWESSQGNICLWFWETFCHSAEGYSPLYQGYVFVKTFILGCYCSSTTLIIWARQCLSLAYSSISGKGITNAAHVHPSLLSTVSIRLFHAMGTE